VLIKEALAIVGGLSKPSKMPGYAYGISPSRCNTGNKLKRVEGSVCSDCYAEKGCYRFKAAKAAHERRFVALSDERWVDAMVTLINGKHMSHFRWHDAGDLQGVWHLEKILAVVRATSLCKHWLPTKESKLIRDYTGEIPENLVIRVSSPIIDMRPLKAHANTSTVHRSLTPHGEVCRAPSQAGACGTCRACWDATVPNVSYKQH